jgi:hypothetical protein
MRVELKVVEFLSSFLKNWEFCLMDDESFSRGLVSEWNIK